MTVVEILRRDPVTALEEVVVRVTVAEPGAPADIEVVSPHGSMLADELRTTGVPDARGRLVGPSDGQVFADALPGAYRGSRLWAERRT